MNWIRLLWVLTCIYAGGLLCSVLYWGTIKIIPENAFAAALAGVFLFVAVGTLLLNKLGNTEDKLREKVK